MVIQRVWRSQSARISQDQPGSGSAAATPTTTSAPATSASDTLATTTANATTNGTEVDNNSPPTTGMRQKLHKNTLSSEATLDALKQRYSTGRSFMSQTANDAAIKSLELLRSVLQYQFDREVDTIVRKFQTTYFVPAIRNIRENLGDGAISEEALKGVFCTLLEASKAQYGASQLASPTGNSLSRANTPGMELSDSDSSTDNAPAAAGGIGVATSLLHQALKRKLPEPNQPDLFKRQYFLHGPIYPHAQYPAASAPSQAGGVAGGGSGGMATTTTTRPTNVTVPETVITPESLFILDFKAARVLGATDFRERLANRHPEVLRYCPDAQDRDWLLQQRQVTPLNKNGRYFLLALDDVRKLIERNAFETSAGQQGTLQGFKVTELIYAKIQKLLKELTERHQRTSAGFEPPKVPASSVSLPNRSRVSSLSSSHATLTALLSTPQPVASGGTESTPTTGEGP
ncbi:suppressor of activated egl-4 protein 2 [Anopheles bellator]|uniref:suppressor of activated egl-4 protein 2 n=1 Tax=Anopheles bellator TaxID=139047 RepID=UPI0026472A64|nr:suppressor of activated egl-4 protein 2 [Anopheles bellator]